MTLDAVARTRQRQALCTPHQQLWKAAQLDDDDVPLWTALRQTIQSYFGEDDLRIEESVLSAFERTDDPAGLMATSDAFLASALRSQPSLAPALETLGVSVVALVKSLPTISYELPPLVSYADAFEGLGATLDVCFTRMPRLDVWNTAAGTVIRRGVLRLDDLILGALETRTLDDSDDRLSASPNHITEALLTAAGNRDASPWGSEADEMFERLPDVFESLRVDEPALATEQLVLYLADDGRVRTARQLFYGPSTISDRRGSAYAITRTSATDAALEELETLINEQQPEEQFQRFFARNPRFLLALQSGWLEARPHVFLHRDESGDDLIPDFVMDRIDGLQDLVELKRPDTRLVVRKRSRDRLSAAVSEAVAQLHTYSAVLERDVIRNRIGASSLSRYRPRLVVVAGRSSAFRDGLDRQGLMAMLPNQVELHTFDDVVDRARLWLPRLLGGT